MIDVPIIDAHHHLCLFEMGYPWLSGKPKARYHGDDTVLRHDYLVEDYLDDFKGLPLAGSVVVENGAAAPLEEARWIDEVCSTSEIPTVQVAKVSLVRDDAPAMLDSLADIETVRGIRDILNWHPDPYYSHTDAPDIISDPTWRRNFAEIGRRGLTFDMQVFFQQLPDVVKLANEYEETQIVLDHLGMPINRQSATLDLWESNIRDLAKCPNVSVKISALGTTDRKWTVESIRPIVLSTIDAFSPSRCMFGSNFPVDGMYSTLAELYSAFDLITQGMSRAEREAIFGKTAIAAYQMPEEILANHDEEKRKMNGSGD